MKRIFVTTLRRVFDKGNLSHGHLYGIDWDTKEIFLDKYIDTETDPSGKSSGLRGLEFYNNNLYVADNMGRIHIFDIENYEYKETLYLNIRHVHQLRKGPDNCLWISCTGTDTLVRMKNDKIIDIYDLSILKDIVDIDKYVTNDKRSRTWGNGRLHFNSIGWDLNNHQIHVYFKAKMIFDWTDKKIIYQGYPLEDPHDIVFLNENSFFVNNSRKRSVVKFIRYNDIFDLIEFGTENGTEIYENSAIMRGFTRGLKISKKDNLLFSCCAPGYIKSYNLETLELIDIKLLNVDSIDNIFDICLDPRDWKY